ncbi:hypothetical protein N7519_002801 [Penicillium mononematosum]|uniref:uncharacterized protein n=1 Tax=Penicillium mononematosum TaxID=268346 RepID=UPI0025465EAE|nr:uncharacterized protein N7519_002801 [Penicillium mononematosum]KAJ6187893.1 hypothetical protein N7519_002801 [Penicillium mononematosum]
MIKTGCTLEDNKSWGATESFYWAANPPYNEEEKAKDHTFISITSKVWHQLENLRSRIGFGSHPVSTDLLP